MYLTAQLVKDADGLTGVQVYGYSHRDATAHGHPWQHLDLRAIAEREPGVLMFAVRDLHTRQNAVLAFLDVLAPEGVPLGTLGKHLLNMPAPELGQRDVEWHYGPVKLRLYVTVSQSSRIGDTYQTLMDRLCGVLGRLAAANVALASTAGPSPVKILRYRTDAGFRFELERPQSLAVSRGNTPTTPRSVSISADTWDDFITHLGHLPVPEIVQVLTNQTLDELVALGGAEVADAETQTPVWSTTAGAVT